MTTNVYLIRHAQSLGNLSGRFQGRIDTPLTPLGLAQAKALGRRFSGVELQAVYASPLERARQTAEAVAAHHGLPVRILPGLTEMYGGTVEGALFTELSERNPEQFRMFDEQPHLHEGFEGAESIAEVYARAAATLQGIVLSHPGQTVAVVSHGCFIRCCVCQAGGGTLQTLGRTKWSGNTGVFHITYDRSGQVALRCENDLAHLDEQPQSEVTLKV